MELKINKRFDPKDYVDVERKHMNVCCKIGVTGQKIHRAYIEYKETNNGLGICMFFSCCGSRKNNSWIGLILDDDLRKITCDRCKPYNQKGV